LTTLITDGGEAAAPLLEEATRTFTEDQGVMEASRRWGWLTVAPTSALWDEKSAYAILARQLDSVRDAGALARLPLDLSTFDLLAVRCGDFASAEGAIAEADALSKATSNAIVSASAMRLAAFRGREEAWAMIESVRREASAAGQGIVIELTEWLLALLYNGVGRYREAVDAARTAGEDRPGEVLVSPWTAMELLEAATRSDNPEIAGIAFERIVAATAFSGTDSAQGILARSRALVSDGATAERFYQEAIERLGRSLLRPELARAHLLFGEWLRRERRGVDAREQLRTAYDQLSSIGMEAFAERARGELLATGEKVRKRAAGTPDELTPQERQIAHLASTGLSNPEIGLRLFLSPRTVEYHLSKVFPKLGVSSRKELGRALRGPVI
jgi:DNA-binding CsgD family transcriptional regulator